MISKYSADTMSLVHVLIEAANAAQPPAPVKREKKHNQGIAIEPGPPLYATVIQ